MRKYILSFFSCLIILSCTISCKESARWSGMEFVKIQDSIRAPYDISIDMEFANGKNPDQQKIANIINAKLQDTFLEKVDTANLPSTLKEYIANLCKAYQAEDEEFQTNRFEHLSGHFEYGLNGVINYIVTEDYFSGGAHPTCNTTVLCFDAETGNLITQDALVVDSCRHKLMDKLTLRLMENHGITSLDSLHALGYLDITDMFISDNFLLGSDSISFYYNPYEIAPYAFGGTIISLSYEELKGILSISDN